MDRQPTHSQIESETLGWDAMIQSDEQPLGILLERELEKEIIKSIDSLGDECKRVFRKSRFSYVISFLPYRLNIQLLYIRQLFLLKG